MLAEVDERLLASLLSYLEVIKVSAGALNKTFAEAPALAAPFMPVTSNQRLLVSRSR